MSSSRLQQWFKEMPPTTLTVLILCTVLYVLQAVVGPSLAAVSLSPRLVLGAGDWYRLVSSGLYHADLMHIMMNMATLVAVGGLVEKHLGTIALAVTILVSLLLTSMLYVGVAWVSYTLIHYQSLMYQHSVGFSGVLFHLSVLECALGGSLQPRSLFGLVTVPPALYPWVLLVVLQFLIPNLSFLGHLSGIIVGTLQVHGYLNVVLPTETTLRELDSLCLAWANKPYCPCQIGSFVHTQSRGDPASGGLGHVVQSVGTGLYQFGEALYVIVFGRGQRLSANASLRQSGTRESSLLTSELSLATRTTPGSTGTTNFRAEQSRLVSDFPESELV